MAEKDKEFVEMVAKALVEKPEAVVVKRSIDEMGVLLELTVDKSDMGVIIGKDGRTAKALRTLLRVLGAKNDARVNLKIVEPEGSDGASEDKSDKPAEEPKEEKVETEDNNEEESSNESAEASEEADEDERPMADLEI